MPVAYLKKPIYLRLIPEEAKEIAGVISGNEMPSKAGKYHYFVNPECKVVINVKRTMFEGSLQYYKIALIEPSSRYTAIYEMIISEKDGTLLRYMGMPTRVLTHFGLRLQNSFDTGGLNNAKDVALFLTMYEEIRKATFS